MRRTEDVLIGSIPVPASLNMSNCSRGIVILACTHAGHQALHGQFFANVLHTFGFGTLLLHLRQNGEPRRPATPPAISQLAAWMTEALHWLQPISRLAINPVGLIGFHEAATAAVLVAAEEPDLVSALVAIQGNPCLLSQQALAMRVPTLLITDHDGPQRIECYHTVLQTWTCDRQLKVLPHALELNRMSPAWNIAAGFAGHWFEHHQAHAGQH